jgi:hypothetical protein
MDEPVSLPISHPERTVDGIAALNSDQNNVETVVRDETATPEQPSRIPARATGKPHIISP